MASAIHGLWAFKERGEDAFVHISPEGRIVQIMRQLPPSTKLVAMKLWCSDEGGGRYRIRSKPDAEGYLILMQRNGDELVFEHLKVRSKTVSRRITEKEAPTWLSGELKKAHEVMTTMEKDFR